MLLQPHRMQQALVYLLRTRRLESTGPRQCRPVRGLCQRRPTHACLLQGARTLARCSPGPLCTRPDRPARPHPVRYAASSPGPAPLRDHSTIQSHTTPDTRRRTLLYPAWLSAPAPIASYPRSRHGPCIATCARPSSASERFLAPGCVRGRSARSCASNFGPSKSKPETAHSPSSQAPNIRSSGPEPLSKTIAPLPKPARQWETAAAGVPSAPAPAPGDGSVPTVRKQ